MRSQFIGIILISTALFACSKSKQTGENEFVTLSYNQTSCSDPWVNGSSDSLTLINIANYLKSLELYVAGLNIKKDRAAEMCLACFCKTGKTIFVSTLNSEPMKARYQQIGFK